jgi:hypothetical protein
MHEINAKAYALPQWSRSAWIAIGAAKIFFVGGIDFGIGLDDDDLRGGQSDDVHLLDKEHFDERWRQYALMEAFDEAVPTSTIVGTKAT